MKLHVVEAGNFKLDGGAMFGVVPKVLWERTNPADENNQIEMACRCLLVEHDSRLILIDTGMGEKQSEKFFSHYHRWGYHTLEGSLNKAGFAIDQITDVFLTHLHFDHCGGAVRYTDQGTLVPSFPNASFWVHKEHWLWATTPNVREKASFLPDNILPLEKSGQLQFIEGSGPLLEKTPFPFSILLVDGHTEKQMLPIIDYRGSRLVFCADLIPTAGHLPIPYVMGYDTRPLLTLDEKSAFLKEAEENDVLLFLEHDPNHEIISLKKTEKGVRMKASYRLDSYFSVS